MEIDTETSTDWVMPQERWYYHIDCFESFSKKKASIKENEIEANLDDATWLDAIYEYLTRDVKIIVNYPKLLSQWNSYIKQGFTPKGIYFTLRYFYEIKGGDASKSQNAIGIVKYIYDEATNYWGERLQRDKTICNQIEQQIIKNRDKKVVKIYQKPNKRREPPIIDWQKIEEMGD